MRIALLLALVLLAGCHRRSSIARDYPAEVTALAREGGPGLPYFVGKDLRPVWKITREQTPRRLSPFRLTDQTGQPVSSQSVAGKVTMVSFFFSHCQGICPSLMRNLGPVQKRFIDEDRVQILSFSITPDCDTPKRLREYGREHRVSSRRWKLLTGERAAIYQLARQSFAADTFSPSENAREKLGSDDFLHSENVYLLDQDGHLRGVYSGRLVGAMEDLIGAAEILLRNQGARG